MDVTLWMFALEAGMGKDEQAANEWFASRPLEEQAALRAGALSWPDRKMQRWGHGWRENGPFDWTTCDRVEVIPGKVSGVPLLIGTRMPADSVLQHFEWGESVEEIVEQFDLDAEDVMGVLRFAGIVDQAAIAA